MKTIFFYNPNHDAERRMASSAPSIVTRVPWGWTPEAEAYRNEMLATVGTPVPSIPALAIWREEETVVTVEESGEEPVETTETIPAHYEVLTADDPRIPRPWDWRNLL